MNRRQVGLIIMLLASLCFIFLAFWPIFHGGKWDIISVIIQGVLPGIPGLIGVIWTIRDPKTGSIISLAVSGVFSFYLLVWTFFGDTQMWFAAMWFFAQLIYTFGAALCYFGSDLKQGVMRK
jgi:hypothetical protein